MVSEIRAIIDTGVAISAVLLPRSVPRQAFDLAVGRGRFCYGKSVGIRSLSAVHGKTNLYFDRQVPPSERDLVAK